MPSPVAHLVTSLGVSYAFMHLSKGEFSPAHGLIFSVNSFFGPDMAPLFEWITNQLHVGQVLGTAIMDNLHHPLWWNLIIAPVSALFYYILLTKTSLRLLTYTQNNEVKTMSFRQMLELTIAGGLIHFALDIPFEENGQTTWMEWILSTGYWEDDVYLRWQAVVVIGLCILILIGGFIYIHVSSHSLLLPLFVASRNEHQSQSQSPSQSQLMNSIKSSLVLLAGTMLLYVVWLVFTLQGSQRVPAVGEEADLGVIVFCFIFILIPLALCSHAVQ